ncbi:kelch repeat-containing protein [Flammeovirga sp. SubArs3]|uniref:Kelch repeat-containing protein n=1 Tax=Flammeovirga sp. SubArs3 TaxID=2995316 RepID=UPI00248ACCCA|nr:kelch repeat-containing protein [Flammeovirga sp. SubArs3]
MKLSSSKYRFFLCFVGVLLQSCISANFREYENATVRFIRSTPLPQPRAYMGYCSNGTSTFVIGGENKSGENFDNILLFNIDREIWSELTPIHIRAEKNINATTVNGSMFLLNGNESKHDENIDDIDINVREVNFNAQIPFLKDVSVNPQPLYKSGLAVSKNIIYAFGGMLDEDTYSNTLYSFNPENSTWKQLASMPKQMITYGATVDGKIYTFGGRNEKAVDDIFMYNIKVNRWVKVGKLPEPIVDAAVTQYRHYIILFSNEQIFIYDTLKGSLKRYQTNIGKLRGMGATISKDKLVIFGGIKQNSSGKEQYSSTVYVLGIDKLLN